jgi:hypothetical protein
MAASLRYQQLAENCIHVLHLDGLDGKNNLRCTLSSILLDDDVDPSTDDGHDLFYG